MPDHPNCTKRGKVALHRHAMEIKIKRFLYPKEVVHHINGNFQDNRLENLRLFKNNKEHIQYEFSQKNA